jgi:hypothetical protein
MKKIILSISLLISFNLYAGSVDTAFEEFYESDEISSRHCGKNIQAFLRYLKNKNITYKSAYVVSVHENVGSLNHFDARWGSKELYQNGDQYFRSNWYFHVFIIIDNKAYDFSQTGAKSLPLSEYLKLSYLPDSKTKNIFFQGVMTKDKALKSFRNLEMNIYETEAYRKNLGPAKYQGVFIELFNL